MSEYEGSTMNPMNYLKVLFRRKEYIIIPAFIGLVAGICAGFVMPKMYKSSAVLLVEDSKSDNPLFDKLAVSTTVKQRLATIRESMLGWGSLVTLVEKLGLDKNITTQRELESLIMKIRGNIGIGMKSHNIIRLSYVSDDPKLAQQVVKNVTDIFIERNVTIQNEDTSDAVTFIEEQLKVYRGKIKSAEIAKLKDKLNKLLIDSTDQHPTVKTLREQIRTMEEELARENLEYTEDTQMFDEEDNPIIDEIKQTLESIEKKSATDTTPANKGTEDEIYKVMLIEKLDNVMARDENVNKKIYNMLLERAETARITQRLQSSKEGTRYIVLDPARVPLRPFKPNKLMIALMGLAAGLGLGVGMIFLFEFLDQSFLDVEEANGFLGQPLLGAVSKIVTEEHVRQRRAKLIWIYSITIVVGCIAIVLTRAYVNFVG